MRARRVEAVLEQLLQHRRGPLTTSPAAIWLTRRSGKDAIAGTQEYIDAAHGARRPAVGLAVISMRISPRSSRSTAPGVRAAVSDRVLRNGAGGDAFLPGDSLLFVAARSAAAGGMDILRGRRQLVAAALCGDNVNYWIGAGSAPRFSLPGIAGWFTRATCSGPTRFMNGMAAKASYCALSCPSVRTYVPFGRRLAPMPYLRYLAFWRRRRLGVGRVAFCLAGFWFGNIPELQSNLTLVIIGIVLLSISPGLIAWVRAAQFSARGDDGAAGA